MLHRLPTFYVARRASWFNYYDIVHPSALHVHNVSLELKSFNRRVDMSVSWNIRKRLSECNQMYPLCEQSLHLVSFNLSGTYSATAITSYISHSNILAWDVKFIHVGVFPVSSYPFGEAWIRNPTYSSNSTISSKCSRHMAVGNVTGSQKKEGGAVSKDRS